MGLSQIQGTLPSLGKGLKYYSCMLHAVAMMNEKNKTQKALFYISLFLQVFVIFHGIRATMIGKDKNNFVIEPPLSYYLYLSEGVRVLITVVVFDM